MSSIVTQRQALVSEIPGWKKERIYHSLTLVSNTQAFFKYTLFEESKGAYEFMIKDTTIECVYTKFLQAGMAVLDTTDFEWTTREKINPKTGRVLNMWTIWDGDGQWDRNTIEQLDTRFIMKGQPLCATFSMLGKTDGSAGTTSKPFVKVTYFLYSRYRT